MKIFAFFILTSVLPLALLAQNVLTDSTTNEQQTPAVQTLLAEPVQHAIYGTALLKVSQVGAEQKTSLLIGGELCWVLNKKYFLGLGYHGLSSVVDAPAIYPVEGLVLVSNYGGVLLGYVHQSHKLIHFEGQALIGFGHAFYRDPEYRAKYNQEDTYVIVEPNLSAVLNVTSGFRLAAGLSYRFANRVDLIGLANKDLSGLTFHLAFKIGRF